MVHSLTPHLKPRHTLMRSIRLFGPALPVQCNGPDFFAMVQALQSAPPPGTVLVVRGPSRLACAGELFTAECRRLGLGGLVVDGCIRDTESIRRMDFPVYSHDVTPAAGTYESPGRVGEPITVGPEDVRIAAGDLLCGDDDGVVCCALSCGKEGDVTQWLEQLVMEAEKIQKREQEVLRHVTEGTPLLSLLGL